MATARFANVSTTMGRNSAISSFTRFLAQNELSIDVANDLIRSDTSGRVLIQILDRYGLHLVLGDGARGSKLAHGTAMLYFNAVKSWLYDQHGGVGQHVEKAVKKIGSSIDRRMKSEAPVMTKQAPACSKADLATLSKALLQAASSEGDYWDAALLVVMWHLFGRSSDMSQLQKRSLSVHPGGAVNVRFGRVKTSLEQGLSLFFDRCLLTCPLHAIVVATVVDIVPSDRLFRQLPLVSDDNGEIDDELPMLLDVLQDSYEAAVANARPGRHRAPGVHSYVNRLLKRVTQGGEAESLTPGLSSHSFRRGGAQAANANPDISLQWIFDRGGWQLSSVNKAFVYIFNTTNEDQQVAKVLSGWEPTQRTWIPSLSALDAAVLPGVRAFLDAALHVDTTPELPQYTFQDGLRTLLGAVLIYHYPDTMKLVPGSLFHRAIRRALSKVGLTENELLSWSLVLRHDLHTSCANHPAEKPSARVSTAPTTDSSEKSVAALLGEQLEMMREIISNQRVLSQRVDALEVAMRTGSAASIGVDASTIDVPTPSPSRARAAAKDPEEAWFLWYGAKPPLWDDKKSVSRQRYSDLRRFVAYMRLFAPAGYRLEQTSATYSLDVLDVGRQAAQALQEYLVARESRAKSVGTMLAALRKIDDCGALADRRSRLHSMIVNGGAVDPTPIGMLLP